MLKKLINLSSYIDLLELVKIKNKLLFTLTIISKTM